MGTLSLAEIAAQIKEHEDQIARLRATAAKQREEEIGALVKELRRQIAEYGISAKELGLTGKSAGPNRRATTARAAAKGPVVRGPNGQTWVSGSRGRKPQWLTDELAKGKSQSEA